MRIITNYDQATYDAIEKKEQALDKLDDELATALVKLSARELRVEDSHEVFELLHAIGDFERIGDHATNLAESAMNIYENGYSFSDAAKSELSTLFAALNEIMNITVEAFSKDDTQLAGRVEPLEEVIDDLTVDIRNRHITRLQKGECAINIGLILTDILTNCERVSDHCSNVGVCIIQIKDSTFETHDYLSELKADQTPAFVQEFSHFQQKYRLSNPD